MNTYFEAGRCSAEMVYSANVWQEEAHYSDTLAGNCIILVSSRHSWVQLHVCSADVACFHPQNNALSEIIYCITTISSPVADYTMSYDNCLFRIHVAQGA